MEWNTLCPKKVVHQIHGDNSVIPLHNFKILLPLERELNFQQKQCSTSHQTFSMLLHYLAKVRSLHFGKAGRKCKRNVTYIDF